MILWWIGNVVLLVVVLPVVIYLLRGVLEAAVSLLVLDEGRPRMMGPAQEVVARLAGPKTSENAA